MSIVNEIQKVESQLQKWIRQYHRLEASYRITKRRSLIPKRDELYGKIAKAERWLAGQMTDANKQRTGGEKVPTSFVANAQAEC